MTGAGPRVERIRSADSPAFDEAWGALFEDCGARGELERREVVADWLSGPDVVKASGCERAYHLVAVRDDEGRLLAVRDHHVVVNRSTAIIVVYMAHALVLPAFRRTGLAEILRAIPLEAGEQARRDCPGADLLLAAEMEPWDNADEATTHRLVSYGRGGFRAIEPARIRYQQPDFRELGPDATARPIPLLAVIRHIGRGDAGYLPKRLAEAYVRHLHVVFATHCRPSDLGELASRSLEAIESSPDDPKLFRLPTSRNDRADLEPLERSRLLSLYPPVKES